MLKDLSIKLLVAAIGGGVAWLWGHLRHHWSLKRGAAFFGLEAGADCRVVIGRYRQLPASSSRDVGAMIEALITIQRFQPTIEALDPDEPEATGDVTEFCIGGPDSNPRAAAHLHSYLGGIEVRSVSDGRHRLEIRTKNRTFCYERGKAEYAVLAKILPNGGDGKPLFLVCGQTAIANRGALYYLRRNWERLLRRRFRLGHFCLVVRLSSPTAYGYRSGDIVEDATASAFCGASSAT